MGRLAILALLLAACGRVGFDDELDGPPAECMVTLDPGTPHMNFNTERTIVADGGLPPYSYSATGAATIDSATGVLTTTNDAGPVMLDVIDDAGCTAAVNLDIGGTTLFYAGGSSMSVPSAQVWKSTDGIAWTLAGSLPDMRTSGALHVFQDKLWWLSGTDGIGPRTEVWTSSDGGTWTEVGDVPVGSANFGSAVFGGKLWMIGGNANPDHDVVISSSDGATWMLEGHLPEANHGGAVAVMGGRMFYIGGHNTGNGQLYSWVVASSDGATWSSIGNLPAGREYAAATAVGNQIVFAGGQDLSSVKTTNVLTSFDGMAFTAHAPLPTARSFGSITMFGSHLFALGGTDGGRVFQALPGNAWTTPTTNFPIPRQSGRVAVFTPQ